MKRHEYKQGPASAVIGIDPGGSGGFTFLDAPRGFLICVAFNHLTEPDIIAQLKSWRDKGGVVSAYLEKVHSMPGQGVSSVFKFGDNFGWWRGVLMALDIPFEMQSPQKWMKTLGMKKDSTETKVQWKNRLKQRAQELYPGTGFTHATGDATLIAHVNRVT